MTPATDDIERVLGANRLLSMPPKRRPQLGGEWDALLSIPNRTRRTLIGAGFLTSTGLKPDVAAECISAGVPGVETTDDAVEWYVRTALVSIAEQRRVRHSVRHHRFAVRQGAVSYFDYRDTVAVLAGFPSLWHYRKAKGWTT